MGEHGRNEPSIYQNVGPDGEKMKRASFVGASLLAWLISIQRDVLGLLGGGGAAPAESHLTSLNGEIIESSSLHPPLLILIALLGTVS